MLRVIEHIHPSSQKEQIAELKFIIEPLEFSTECCAESKYPFVLRREVLEPENIVDEYIDEKGFEPASKALEVVKNNNVRGKDTI